MFLSFYLNYISFQCLCVTKSKICQCLDELAALAFSMHLVKMPVTYFLSKDTTTATDSVLGGQNATHLHKRRCFADHRARHGSYCLG